jgi:CRISPR-associated protein Csb2
VVDGPFDPGLIVMRQVGGRKFSLESCGMIADAVRITLMSRHGAGPPEWLSGHQRDGSPSTIRRLVYLPLAFVDHEHADGHLLGIALAVPRTFTEDYENRHLWKLLGQHGRPDIGENVPYLSLKFHGLELELELDESGDRNIRQNLRPSVWCAPVAGSRKWATVTPLVLPLVPRRALTIEAVIGRACADAGLPKPIAVRASLAPLITGVPHAKSFRFDPCSRRPRRPIVHAEIEFSLPVRGPVIIGAGRYAGYGLCRPRRDEEPS